jgi:ribosomal protein S12 methylthiotransferase
VHLVSLGCAKNRIDTEAVMGQLAAGGYGFTSDIGKCGTVIVNTCGFLRSAVEEGLATISALAAQKDSLGFRLVVTGCLVQRMGRELKRRIPAIDSLVGVHGYGGIIRSVEGRSRLALPAAECSYPARFYNGRVLTTGPGWAYLRIADGCDNRCSYCLIPALRGRYRSRPMGEIVREAKIMVGRGVREINLIAQDTTNYGSDLYGRRRLPDLLKSLCRIGGLAWVRLLYTHPAHFDDRLIETVAAESKVVKYLDIPLQHFSDAILKGMGRRVDGAGISQLIERIRNAIPGVVLRTTMMVGYPGEKQEDFDRLCRFVRATKFDRLGAFAYSAEPGTSSAGMSGQVPQRVKDRRLDFLMRLQKNVSLARNRQRVGLRTKVLIEGVAGRAGSPVPAKAGYRYFGRSCAEAPEVDGKIYLREAAGLAPGVLREARIQKAWAYDLGGEIVRK